MSHRDPLLFGEHSLTDLLERNGDRMLEEIDAIDGDELLNTSPDALCDYFEERFKGEAPALRETDIHVDQPRDVGLYAPHPGFCRPISRGTAVTYRIPFDGESVLFSCQPSTFTQNPPRAKVEDRELLVTVDLPPGTEASTVKALFENQVTEIKGFLQATARDVETYNRSVRLRASERIEARRQKLLADRQLVAELGYPLRPRPDANTTYTVPTVRRRPQIQRPSGGGAPFAPEPELATEEYEQILSIMGNVGRAMELSPAAFSTLREEDLRTHFLVQLNGQYEGQATGETFNLSGKTDIIIRERDRNIFIAECKFWSGPKSLANAIDQLLNYTSWRDTKTAILVFNKGGKLSTVLEKIPGVVSGHTNYRRQVPYESETGFRFHLHHRDDPGRELVLSVLVFEVPESEQGEQPL